MDSHLHCTELVLLPQATLGGQFIIRLLIYEVIFLPTNLYEYRKIYVIQNQKQKSNVCVQTHIYKKIILNNLIHTYIGSATFGRQHLFQELFYLIKFQKSRPTWIIYLIIYEKLAFFLPLKIFPEFVCIYDAKK